MRRDDDQKHGARRPERDQRTASAQGHSHSSFPPARSPRKRCTSAGVSGSRLHCNMLRIGAVVAVALGLIDAATGFKGHATAALRVRARLVCRRPVALSHLRCGVDRGDFRCGKASSLSETSPEAAPPSLPRVPNVCSLFLLHGIGWQQELISGSCRVRLPHVRSQGRLRRAA